MSEIAASQVSLYPNRYAEAYDGALAPNSSIERRLKLTSVISGDTASAAVLGLAVLARVSAALNTTGSNVVPCAVNPVTNTMLVGTGTGTTASTMYVTVSGSPTTT